MAPTDSPPDGPQTAIRCYRVRTRVQQMPTFATVKTSAELLASCHHVVRGSGFQRFSLLIRTFFNFLNERCLLIRLARLSFL